MASVPVRRGLGGARRVVTRVARERHPARFLVSRALRESGLADRLRLSASLGDMRFYLRASSHSCAIWVDRTVPEPSAPFRLLDRLLAPGGVCVDVGANIGIYATRAARLVGPAGRVLAVEPHPRIFRYLNENISLNRLQNVTALQCAIGAAPGIAHLTDHHADDINRVSGDGGIAVPQLRLDDVCADYERIDLLKIDVEDGELAVLRGAESTLARTSAVLIEVWHEGSRDLLRAFRLTTLDTTPVTQDLLGIRPSRPR